MEKLTVVGLLSEYENWLEKGEVQFLTAKSDLSKPVLKLVKELKIDFIEAETKPGEMSENLDWADIHEKGRELWKKLASASINHIERNSKGNLDLFKYLEAATEFEDLLYGLEPYYRDHTLHSLWVYLIGEHLLRNDLNNLYIDLNWYLYNDIEKDKTSYSQKLLNDSKKKIKELCKEVNKKKDAIWCIIALCHDLGYSLAKLDKLNAKAKNVLDFFHISGSRQIGYSLDIEHHYLVNQLLELMSMDVRVVPSTTKDDVLIKCYRDDSTYWLLCKALEKKEHGILSAYLLFKTLGIFADTWVRGSAEEWGLDDQEAIDNIAKGVILFAITQHEFEFSYINVLGGLSELLIIADELEEFSRYGRKLLSRKYYDTAAEADIKFKMNNLNGKKEVEIEINYEVAQNRPIGDFFVRKSEKLCRIFTLKQELDNNVSNSRPYRIKSIRLVAEKENAIYAFQMESDNNSDFGMLPGSVIDGKTYNKGRYNMLCIDDKIFIIIDNKQIPIKDWFENIKD